MFFDRYDAGKQLATKLKSYQDSGAIVLALPRGGVPVGYEIATQLHLPLDIVITRKIGHPSNQEVAICAVTEDGHRICNEDSLQGINEQWLEEAQTEATAEAKRRRRVFGSESPSLIKNQTIIITDDGVATGLTMKAALLTVRSQKPKKIVLAIPVCPPDVLAELQNMVDEVVLLDKEEPYRGAVGAYYSHFPQTLDQEVATCLKSAALLHKPTTITNHSQTHL